MKFGSFFRENIRLTIGTIKSNLLRTILTMMIIAIGIMALVGIITASESMKNSITSSFSSMGANSFKITTRSMFRGGSDRARTRNRSNINFMQAYDFKNRFADFPATVSISINVSWGTTVKYLGVKTNPNIGLLGIDENGITSRGLDIDRGRNFSSHEVDNGSSVAIIGSDVAATLFKNDNPIDKMINIGGIQYNVVGVLKSKGSGFGQNEDAAAYIPITKARSGYSLQSPNCAIDVTPNDPNLFDAASGFAEGQFRLVRGLSPFDENDFEVERSDSLANMMLENIGVVTLAATIIGLITLLGAAVGLMNIMLVSVGERTREIGTRKALGAKRKTIKQQFLFESIIISLMGGVVGIALGILIGNVTSMLTGSPFYVPWIWISIGLGICFVVGISSGYLPAAKASKMDPIEALRYE